MNMSCRTDCYKKLSLIAAVLALVVLAIPAFAQNTCLQNEYNISQGVSATGTVGSTKLNCTANDVRIAEVSNVRDPATGGTLSSCVLGSHFDFIADFKVVTSSTSSRSNIGMYVATNSTTQALTGACSDNLIPPPATIGTRPKSGLTTAQFPCTAGSNIQCGTNYYDEFDPAPDSCGDTSSQDNGGAAATQIITMLIPNYSCTPPAGTNQLVLPNCTSWQIPGGTIQCQAPSGQQSWNISAIPGTKSKCNCAVISLPVIAQTPSVAVQKECTTPVNNPGPRAFDPGNPNAQPPVAPTQSPVACNSGVEGSDTVTYHVQVTNQSNFGNVTVTTLTDSAYGNIGGSCPSAGCTALSTGCTLPQTIAAGSNYECSFTAKSAGTASSDAPTVTNHVTANGTSQFGGAFGPSNSNDVTATPTEAPSSATVTKSLNSLRAASIQARFAVDVQNTSSSQFDENETLTALSDSVFGAVSPTPSSSIDSTTCFTSASVALPVGGTGYQCTYDVTIPLNALSSVKEYGTGTCNTSTHFCSAGLPNATACNVNSDCDSSCLGLHHSNYVTAAINGDEGAADLVTPTRNTLDTDVCLTSFTLSH
jgi:hypothetical protein